MQLNTDTKFVEMLRENKQRVYDFLSLMLSDPSDVEEQMVRTYRSFSLASSKKTAALTELDLFSRAWQNAQVLLRTHVLDMSTGRDTRVLSSFDENLLIQKKLSSEQQATLKKRLATIDPDFKAPVVLKDILKFEDEEILKILSLRWGVYRHRLHRGRLEIKDSLKGKATAGFVLGKPVWVT